MTHNLLNIQKSESYVPYQDLENTQMLAELLDGPTRFLDSIRRSAASLTTQMVFGFRIKSMDDPKLAEITLNVDNFAEMVQGTTAAMMEVFPILRYIPTFLSPIKKRAELLHKTDKTLFMTHWLNAKQSWQQGTGAPCFCADMASVQAKEGFDADLACYTAGSILEAGSDTTANTIYAFVQAMLLFPDIQHKLQQNIDEFVGDERLPIMEDYHELPYVRSTIKESLRWMPTAIIGIPHAVTRDDTYCGYIIPKGAGILENIYTIQRDPQRHADPRRFDPDRYQDDATSLAESATNPDASKRGLFAFGAGRRICQGIHVSERSLFLAIARLAWAFDITPIQDENGRDVIPDPDKLTQGAACMPEPFQAVIKPRSEKRARVIRESWRAAKCELDPETMQWLQIPHALRVPGLKGYRNSYE